MAKFYINTISRDHVRRGVEGGFTQANHGKPNVLKRLKKGDWIVFYSPKTAYVGGETPIRPLINDLSFIKNKQSWGFMFRFGMFEIPKTDFELIKNAMIKAE